MEAMDNILSGALVLLFSGSFLAPWHKQNILEPCDTHLCLWGSAFISDQQQVALSIHHNLLLEAPTCHIQRPRVTWGGGVGSRCADMGSAWGKSQPEQQGVGVGPWGMATAGFLGAQTLTASQALTVSSEIVTCPPPGL